MKRKIEKSFKATINITIYAVRMFFRDKRAIFWSLFLPIMIMSIFGVMDFEGANKVSLGIVNKAENEQSEQFIKNLSEIETLKITDGRESDEKNALEKGDRDMVLILPYEFGQVLTQPEGNVVSIPENPLIGMSKEQSEPLKIEVYYNEGKANQVQIGTTILSDVFDQYTHIITQTPNLFELDKKPISSRNLSYVDFLIPGIVAMSIMQMGLIGVASAIVNWKERGILRRLLATPVYPSVIIFSQVITRLIISILQSGTIILLGVVMFDVKIAGNIGLIFFLSVLGGAIFLSIGFAISGFGKTHNSVMALSNVIMMPMMFLSGVFFPRDALPELLKNITQYLPLTYLADAMRKVMTEGHHILQIQTEMLGLLAWVVISFVLATKLFRWE